MQINAQKDNNENVMRINMTNMIYIGQYFMYMLKKKTPPLHEDRGFITKIILYYM